jgi:hypothetical protein
VVLLLLTTPVPAGESIDALTGAGMPLECAPFGAKVSASEGNFTTISNVGCLGAFQFCPGTFEDYYSKSPEEFLKTPADQVHAWSHYQHDQWTMVMKNHLDSLIDKRVCYNNRCAVIHQSAIIMACQFGCGAQGKLANYIRNSNCNAREVMDGNGTSVCEYLVKGAGYDVSCFTGGKC